MQSSSLCNQRTGEWLPRFSMSELTPEFISFLEPCVAHSPATRFIPAQLLSAVYLEAVWGLPCWLREQRICLQCRRPRFNPWVRKTPKRRNGCPLQHSCLENSRREEPDGPQSTGSQKSWTRLGDWAWQQKALWSTGLATDSWWLHHQIRIPDTAPCHKTKHRTTTSWIIFGPLAFIQHSPNFLRLLRLHCPSLLRQFLFLSLK